MTTLTVLRNSLVTLLVASSLLLGACQTRPTPGLTSEQLAVLQTNGFRPIEEGWGLDLSGKILFQFAEETISDESREYIIRLTRALLDAQLSKVRIDGHTDNSGDAAFNLDLSLRRAQAVAALMTSAGMDDSSVQARGLSDSKPVTDNSTRENRSQNRRVSIVITTP